MDSPEPTKLSYATPSPGRRRGWFVALLLGAMVVGGVTFVLLFRVQVQVTPRVVTPPVPPAPAIPTLRLNLGSEPQEFTLAQRSGAAIPGSNNTIHVAIGDITRGQTLLSVAGTDGYVLVGQRSVRAGDRVAFTVGGVAHDLEVVELRNFLTGDDHAIVRIGVAGAKLTEQQKIDALIRHVGSLQGVAFIRDGTDHTAPEAADHLRRKLGGRVMTATQFIEELGTASSVSGEPYRIRLKDGTEVPAGEYLKQRLDEIESTPAERGRAGGG